jgi:hypothetical protein
MHNERKKEKKLGVSGIQTCYLYVKEKHDPIAPQRLACK